MSVLSVQTLLLLKFKIKIKIQQLHPWQNRTVGKLFRKKSKQKWDIKIKAWSFQIEEQRENKKY